MLWFLFPGIFAFLRVSVSSMKLSLSSLMAMRAISSLLSGAHAVLAAGPFNLCDDDAHSPCQCGIRLIHEPSCRQHIDRFTFNLPGDDDSSNITSDSMPA